TYARLLSREKATSWGFGMPAIVCTILLVTGSMTSMLFVPSLLILRAQILVVLAHTGIASRIHKQLTIQKYLFMLVNLLVELEDYSSFAGGRLHHAQIRRCKKVVNPERNVRKCEEDWRVPME